MADIPLPEIERFHLRLMEACDAWPGFTKLPPKAASKERVQRLFHLCYVRHYVNEEPVGLPAEESENWVMVKDERAAWLVAVPREYCPEGIDPWETVTTRLSRAQERIRGYAKRYESIYGKFQVAQRDGAVYVRHVGFVNRDIPPMEVLD